MADAEIAQISTDEKIAQAQELLSIATRNYYVKAYSDAVDDFSTVCSIFSEVYGPNAEELGKPYLMYAKCLIAVGQEENKLMEIPEEEGEEGDDDDDDEEGDEEGEEKAPATTNGVDKTDEVKENGTSAGPESSASAGGSSSAPVDPAQPGTSSGITNGQMDTEATAEDDEDDVANLQVAWEVLELAVGIFSRLPERRKELAESYIELAGISFENSNMEAAIKDFKQALTVLQELPEKDNRELAEINYKIGLAYTMLNMFEEAKIALMKACCYLDDVIKTEQAKEEQTEEVLEVIKDLKETKTEIENKIVEVEDYKQQSMDVVKQELAKLVGHQDSFDKAAGEGSSAAGASVAKPAADISHLIKRKKPDEAAAGGAAANDITHLVKRKKEDE